MPKSILYTLCILTIIFSGLAFSATPVMATSIDYVPLAPFDVQGSEFTSGTSCIAPTCFPKYLRTIYNVGVALAGLFAVFSIVRGGFELLFTDSILGHSEGKAIILRALGGLVIVYASYIFMNQISPSLGRDLDLSLAFERVPKALTGRGLTIVPGSDEDKVKAFNEAVDKIIANSKTAGERATAEEKIRNEILDAPDIVELARRRSEAGRIEFEEGGVMPDGLNLSAEENAKLDTAILDANEHQRIADNTRQYSAIHTIGQQVTNANLLIEGGIFKPGASNAGDPEGNARLLREQVQRNIDEMKEIGGKVATAEIKGDVLAVDPIAPAKPLDPELDKLIISANKAVSALCNKQYSVTTDTPATTPGIRNPVTGTVSPPIQNQQVLRRNQCITTNTVKK